MPILLGIIRIEGIGLVNFHMETLLLKVSED
jgi:hypothetical protein